MFTYCDKAANSNELMPDWLVQVHYIIRIGEDIEIYDFNLCYYHKELFFR